MNFALQNQKTIYLTVYFTIQPLNNWLNKKKIEKCSKFADQPLQFLKYFFCL